MEKILNYLNLSLPTFFYDNLISFGIILLFFLVALIGFRKILKTRKIPSKNTTFQKVFDVFNKNSVVAGQLGNHRI